VLLLCGYFDFLNNQQFQFFKIFRIEEPPLSDFVLKKSELENLPQNQKFDGYFINIIKLTILMKEWAKN
jgi:hypothetical protein